MNFSTTETRWIKFGKAHDFVFVGKETIATASSIYVNFLDLNTKERRIERFNNKERGDGASCLAGHPTVSMFSVVERKLNPKISIFMYPTLQRISRCVLSDKIYGYLSCSFVGTEYLVSLTSFPDFRLIVWLWRTGKHIASLDTKVDNLVQEIYCSPNPPHLISQLGINDSTLSIYQVHTCSKIVNIHRVNVPITGHKVVSLSWTPEGNLYISDEFGNVWLVAIEANKLFSVIKSKILERPKNKPIVVSHKNGVIVVNTNNDITFYKKTTANWNVTWKFMWSISTFYSIQVGKQHYFKDGILLHSKNGEIFEICTQHDNIPHIEVIYTDEIEYKTLFSMSQRTDHVAAIDRLNRLCIFELLTGKLTARLSLKHHGEVLQVDSHPTLPMLASCSFAGNCLLIDITRVSLPKAFNCFHLCGDLLDKIKFSRHGEFLGIGNSGMIFIIGKRPKQQRLDVLGFIEIDGYITDFLIYERSDNRFEMLVLATANSSTASIGGDKVIVYTCEISIDFCTHAICVIDLSRPFRTLYHGSKPLSILGIPSLSKQLHQMEVENDFQDIVLSDALFSMHQMRNIGIYVTDSRVITYGYDGLIMIRDSAELHKVFAIFMPHHRNQGGVKHAISSRFGDTIVSLGRNGDLVANRLRLIEAKINLAETETASVHLTIEDFTSDPNELYGQGKECWLDSKIAAKLKAEHDEAVPLRASIVADLEKIKTQIRELLDMNEGESPDARLPISTFDLNRKSRQQRIEEARIERDKLHRKLEEDCAQRDQVTSNLREIFWEPLQVKPCALRSIGGDTIIRNYPLVASTRKTNDYKVWDRLSSDTDEFLYSYEVFNGSADKEEDSRRGSIFENKEFLTTNNENKAYQTAEKWYTLADEDEKLCISGITTHKWIEDESIASTHQLLIPCDSDLEDILQKDVIIENRERKLKMYFNELFDKMRHAKERVLKCAKERISRLRYCASQLNTMFGIDSTLEPIETPTWNVEEIPDYIVTVEDHEVFEKQSQRGELKNLKIADEVREEKNKNEKINDFYKIALEKMMDGVLELKWEDEVKKEIPVPDCLITKDPSKYTDEDIAVIASYKSKIQALQEEREKYRVTLEADIIETKDALQRDIVAFNDKLKDLELKKIQIECAIFQERLMRIRAIQRYRSMVDGRKEIACFANEEVASATREARKLAEESNTLEMIVSELKVRYDSLCKAEKRQEAKFRGEFAELKQPIVEHLFRHYKKRPRIGRLTTTSVTYLIEVANCVANNEKSNVLPRECLDFLKGMDILDSMPRNLPSQINADYWQMMCKLRRMKVEMETKVRCCAVEMAEAEQTLSFYQKAMQSADNVVACKKASLDNMEKSLSHRAQEMEIQLVLKMGQIEVPLQGCPSDYENAVLVMRKELLRVNDCIVETGKRKLAAMHKSMHLRKIVSQHEWQHACAKMVMEDLQRDLKDIQEFKITRNVLELLNNYPCSVNLEGDYEKMQVDLRIFRNKFRQVLEQEQARLKETKRLMAKWKKKNDKISQEIKSKSSEVEDCRRLLEDPHRKRDEESRRMRLAAVARRTKLVMKAEDNYEQLLILHAQLEVLKLRTYPTLQFKTA